MLCKYFKSSSVRDLYSYYVSSTSLIWRHPRQLFVTKLPFITRPILIQPIVNLIPIPTDMYYLKLIAPTWEIFSSERSVAGTHETLTDVVKAMVLWDMKSVFDFLELTT